MLSHFHILTVTHKKTDLQEIGKYIIKAADSSSLKAQLESLKEDFSMKELLYVSTCNRVMYFFTTPQEVTSTFIKKFFLTINPKLTGGQLDRTLDVVTHYKGLATFEHLSKVASSIDSMVVGEREILRQLREAYDQCQQWGLTGDDIRLVFQLIVVAAKEVYAQTRIGEKPVSVVSLAVQQLLRAQLPKQARILLVGAGQTNELVAKFLHKHQYNNVMVFNRTLSKAQNLAELLDGEAAPLIELPFYKNGFDCIIVCTGSTSPIITKDLYTDLLNGESEEKIIVDLAIPYNVSEEVPHSFPVHYIEINGLRDLAKENLAFREQEVLQARELLDDHIERFPTLYQHRQIERAMNRVPQEIKAVKTKAINEVFKKEVESLDDSTRDLVERMLAYMEKKCIGIPMRAARESFAG